MIAYWIDTPARWLLQRVGMTANELPLFIAGTFQWALVAWGLSRLPIGRKAVDGDSKDD